jgi:hypothetical protein
MEEDCTYWLCIVSLTTWFCTWGRAGVDLGGGLAASHSLRKVSSAPASPSRWSWLQVSGELVPLRISFVHDLTLMKGPTLLLFFGSVLSTIPHVALAPFQFRYLPAIFFLQQCSRQRNIFCLPSSHPYDLCLSYCHDSLHGFWLFYMILCMLD